MKAHLLQTADRAYHQPNVLDGKHDKQTLQGKMGSGNILS